MTALNECPRNEKLLMDLFVSMYGESTSRRCLLFGCPTVNRPVKLRLLQGFHENEVIEKTQQSEK